MRWRLSVNLSRLSGRIGSIIPANHGSRMPGVRSLCGVLWAPEALLRR
jgi:hypothetical protein